MLRTSYKRVPMPLQDHHGRMDYLGYIDLYHERIKAFHVKDAEFNPDARTGAYGGYLPWVERAGRFRSVGDGEIDFPAIFAKLAQYDSHPEAPHAHVCRHGHRKEERQNDCGEPSANGGHRIS